MKNNHLLHNLKVVSQAFITTLNSYNAYISCMQK